MSERDRSFPSRRSRQFTEPVKKSYYSRRRSPDLRKTHSAKEDIELRRRSLGSSSFHRRELNESSPRRSSVIYGPERNMKNDFYDGNQYFPEDVPYVTREPALTDFVKHVPSNLDPRHHQRSESCNQYTPPRSSDFGHPSVVWNKDYDFNHELSRLDGQLNSITSLSTNHQSDQNLAIDLPEYSSSFGDHFDVSFRNSTRPRNITNSHRHFSSDNSRFDGDMRTNTSFAYPEKYSFSSSNGVLSHPTHDLDILSSTDVTSKHPETSAYPCAYNSTVAQRFIDRNHSRELDNELSSGQTDYADHVFKHPPVAADHEVSANFIMPGGRDCTTSSVSFGSYVSENSDCKSKELHSTALRGNRVDPRESILSRLGPLVNDVPYPDNFHVIDNKESFSHTELSTDWASTSSQDISSVLSDCEKDYSRNEGPSSNVLARPNPRSDLRWGLGLNHPLEQSLSNRNENEEDLRKTINETRVDYPNVSDALPQIGPSYSTSKVLDSVPFRLESDLDNTSSSSNISNSYSMSLGERSHVTSNQLLLEHPYSSARTNVLNQQPVPSDEYVISPQSSYHWNVDPDCSSAHSPVVSELGSSKTYDKVIKKPKTVKYPPCALLTESSEFNNLNEESHVKNTRIETFPSHSACVSEEDRSAKEGTAVPDYTTTPATECDYSKVASRNFQPLKSPVCNVSTALPFSNFLNLTSCNPAEVFQGDSATSSLSLPVASEFEKTVTCESKIKKVTDTELEYARTYPINSPITLPTICNRNQIGLSDDASCVDSASNASEPSTLQSNTSMMKLSSPARYHGINKSVTNSKSVDTQVSTAQSSGGNSSSADGTKGETHILCQKVVTLARLVIGEELSIHLSQFTTSSNGLFKQLFGGCVTVINCLAWKKDGLSLAPQVTSFFKSHLKGFYSGTLNQNGILANSNILYTKELSHLRSLCGNNVLKWNDCIRKFALLTSMIPATPEKFILEYGQDQLGASESPTESEIIVESSVAKVNETIVSPCKSSKPMELPLELSPASESGSAHIPYMLVTECNDLQFDSVGYGSKERRPKSVNLMKDSCPEEGFQDKAHAKGEIVTSSSSCHSLLLSPTRSKILPCPTLITSTIPVRSPQKTAQGLQSLLNIVRKSKMKVSIPDPFVCKEDKAAATMNSDRDSCLDTSKDAQSVSSMEGAGFRGTPLSPISQFEGQQELSSDNQVSDKRGVDHIHITSESGVNDSMTVIGPAVNSNSTISSNLALTNENIMDFQSKSKTVMLQEGVSKKGTHMRGENVVKESHQKYSSTTTAPNTLSGATPQSDEGNTNDQVGPQSVPAQEHDQLVAFEKCVDVVKDSEEKQVETKPGHSPNPGGHADDITKRVMVDEQFDELDNRNGSLSPGEIRSPSPTLMVDSDKNKNSSTLPYSSVSRPTERFEQPLKHQLPRKASTQPYRRNQRDESDNFRHARESTLESRYGYRPRSERFSRYQNQYCSRSPPRMRSSGKVSHPNKLRSNYTRNSNITKTAHSKSRGYRVSPGTRRSRDGQRSRSRSCSEDELELLELKKKVIMSMIQNDKQAGASNQETCTSLVVVGSGNKTSTETAPPLHLLPPSFGLLEKRPLLPPNSKCEDDDLCLLDMEICDTSSESDSNTTSDKQPVFIGEIVNETSSQTPVALEEESLNTDVQQPLFVEQKVDDHQTHVEDLTHRKSLVEIPLCSLSFVASSHVTNADTNSPVAYTGTTRTKLPLTSTHEAASQSIVPSAVSDQIRTISKTSHPSFSVKVVPANKKTWNIEEVHIVPMSDTETESSDVERNSPCQTNQGDHKYEGSAISQFLVKARKAAENSTKLKQKSLVPLMMPTPQKQEYLELKKKLTMYEKRKKLNQSRVSRLLEPHDSTSLKKTRSPPPNPQEPKVVVSTVKNIATPIPDISSAASKHPLKAKVTNRLRERKIAVYKKHLSSIERIMEKHWIQRIENQHQINSVTNELTDCELHIEESELKVQALLTQISNLQIQVEIAKKLQSEADLKKSELLVSVRLAKERFSQNDKEVKEAKMQVTLIKTTLCKLENLRSSVGPKPITVCPPTYEVMSDSQSPSYVNSVTTDLLYSKERTSRPVIGAGDIEPKSVTFQSGRNPAVLHIPQIVFEPVTDSDDSTSQQCSSIGVKSNLSGNVNPAQIDGTNAESCDYPITEETLILAASSNSAVSPRFSPDVEAISDSESTSMIVTEDVSKPPMSTTIGAVSVRFTPDVEVISDSECVSKTSLIMTEDKSSPTGQSPVCVVFEGTDIQAECSGSLQCNQFGAGSLTQLEHSYCKSVSVCEVTDSSNPSSTLNEAMNVSLPPASAMKPVTTLTIPDSVPTSKPSPFEENVLVVSKPTPVREAKDDICELSDVINDSLSYPSLPLTGATRPTLKSVQEESLINKESNILNTRKGSPVEPFDVELVPRHSLPTSASTKTKTISPSIKPSNIASIKPTLLFIKPSSLSHTLKPPSAEPTPVSTEPRPVPTEPRPVPTEPRPAPTSVHAVPTPTPAEPRPAPTEPTPIPAEPTPIPAEPTPIPAEPTPIPAEPTPIPAEPTPIPAEPTPIPAECTSVSAEPRSASTPVPAEPTPVPNEPMTRLAWTKLSAASTHLVGDEVFSEHQQATHSPDESPGYSHGSSSIHLDIEQQQLFIKSDQIFHCGTNELFTLSADEPPEYVVPVGNLDTVFSFEVDPACISEVILTNVHDRAVCSFKTRTNRGLEAEPIKTNSPSLEGDVTFISDVSIQEPVSDKPQSQVDVLDTSHSPEAMLDTSHSPEAMLDTSHSPEAMLDSSHELQRAGEIKLPLLKCKKKSLKLTPDQKKKLIKKMGTMSFKKGVSADTKQITSPTTYKKSLGEKLQKHVKEIEQLKDHLASKIVARGNGPTQKSETGKSQSARKKRKLVHIIDDLVHKVKRHRGTNTDGDIDQAETMEVVKEQDLSQGIENASMFTDDKSLEQITKLLDSTFKQCLPNLCPLSVGQVQHLLSSSHQPSSSASLLETFHRPISSCCLSSTTEITHSSFNASKDINTSTVKTHVTLAVASSNKTLPLLSNPVQNASFVPYSSPLLTFSSYRLNPAYRNHEKLKVSSLTYCNKLNPKQILCKFEAVGVCRDPKCTAQHLRDIQPSREEIVSNLVSYAPSLVDCAQEELLTAEMLHPQSRKELASKFSNYASLVIAKYSPKLSDEEIFNLTTHNVSEGKRTVDVSRRRGYVSFDQCSWLTESSLPESGSRPGSSRMSAGSGAMSVPGIEGLGWDNAVSLEASVDGHLESKRKMRYFTKYSTKPQGNSKSGEESVSHYMQEAIVALRQGDHKDYLSTLENGLKKHAASVELWVYYLRAHSSLTSSQINATTDVQSLDELCARAMSNTHSYAVVVECVSVSLSYQSKVKWIGEGLKMLVGLPVTTTTSHECLELLLNLVFLNVSLEKTDVAMEMMESALFGKSVESMPSHLKSLVEHLTPEDSMMACICNIHLVYWGHLPSCVMCETLTYGVSFPFQIASKKPICIEWKSDRELTNSQCVHLKKIFETSLQLFPVADSASNTSRIDLCLPLYETMFSFELVHGHPPKAVLENERLLASTPTVAELWLLYSRIHGVADLSSDMFSKATSACPRSARLYFLAAQMELSNMSKHLATPISHSSTAPSHVTTAMERAVDWLERCVREFYKMPSNTQDSRLSVETVQLYRKLLGQLVPYDLKIPDFAEGVHCKQLDKQLAPLWMCYCLWVELTTPNSSSSEFYHQTATDAYESAIHSLHDNDDSMLLWGAYISFLKSNMFLAPSNAERFKTFLSCVKRCLLATEHSFPYSSAVYGRPSQYKDYTFHNKILDLLFGSVHFSPGQRLSLLQSFGSLIPNNPHLVSMMAKCYLEQTPQCSELAQSVLAVHLSKFPMCRQLWKMAISIEQLLKHTMEVRWMYQQSLEVLPHDASLWREFLVFELKETVNSPHLLDLNSHLLSSLVHRAHNNGVDFHRGLPSQ